MTQNNHSRNIHRRGWRWRHVLLGTPARPRERTVYNLKNSDAIPASKSACEKRNHWFPIANNVRNLLSGSQGLKENMQWWCSDLSAKVHVFIYQIISQRWRELGLFRHIGHLVSPHCSSWKLQSQEPPPLCKYPALWMLADGVWLLLPIISSPASWILARLISDSARLEG